MANAVERRPGPETKGRVLHGAVGYDVLAWLLLHGQERRFRERLLELGRIGTGESVLDIGCGTGSLALAAKRRVGPSGSVSGVDASPEMIARARRKASKAHLDITFSMAAVEALPFQDGQFDVALSTLMLHHLPRQVRRQCAAELHRVLKPGGRALTVDFVKSSSERKGLVNHFHRHGRVDMADVVQVFGESGFAAVDSGDVGVRDLSFVLFQSR